MRVLVLLLLLSVSVAIAAQPSPYRPLAVGNTWTFARTSSSSASPTPTLESYLRTEVLRDTVVAGRDARVMGCQQFALDGTPGQEGRAVAFLMPGATVLVSGVPECARQYDGPAPYPPAGISNPLMIGGTAYTMTSVLSAAYPVGPGGTHGGGEYSFDYADPVGMVRFGYYGSSSMGGQPVWSRQVWTLDYAVVDGMTYGLNPVAGEGGPAEPSAFVLTAAPSPTSDAVTLRLTGARGAVVTVYSVTGRRVFTGETAGGTLALDTRAWAPGVYVARAVAGGQAATARIVVAR